MIGLEPTLYEQNPPWQNHATLVKGFMASERAQGLSALRMLPMMGNRDCKENVLLLVSYN